MVHGAFRSQIDRFWDAFWSGGISNPLEVIEQITYLLFIRRLDELHTLEEYGMLEPQLLYQSPYTDLHPTGVEGIFTGPDIDALFAILSEIGERAVVVAA